MRKLAVLIALFGFVACSTSSDQESDNNGDDSEAQAVQPETESDEETAEADDGQVPDNDGEASDDGDAANGDETAGGPEVDGVDETDESQDRPAPLWQREGLDVQQRMADLRAHSDMHDPETTDWRESRRDIPDELADVDGDGPGSAGQLLFELVDAFNFESRLGVDAWEQTMRVHSDGPDAAVGVIMQWGFKDDATAGSDLRVSMEYTGEAWQITSLEERFHCRRGISDGLCL